MTNMRHTSALLLSIAMLGVVGTGCSQGDPQGETGASGSSIEPLVLFQDPSRSGPRLDVYEFAGHPAISVGGPIGTESLLAASAATDSLADLYLTVHPEAKDVPADLLALSERLEPALAELRALPRSNAPAVTVDKTLAAFNATVCKTFNEGGFNYVPQTCPWSASANQKSIFNWPLNITAGDRTYAWNNNNTTATLNWWAADSGGLFYVAAWTTLPAYWWKWMSMGGGGPYFADIRLSNGIMGELGITHHDRQ